MIADQPHEDISVIDQFAGEISGGFRDE